MTASIGQTPSKAFEKTGRATGGFGIHGASGDARSEPHATPARNDRRT